MDRQRYFRPTQLNSLLLLSPPVLCHFALHTHQLVIHSPANMIAQAEELAKTLSQMKQLLQGTQGTPRSPGPGPFSLIPSQVLTTL